MDEPITVTCPHCRQSLSVPAEDLGQRAECSLCGRMFTVQTGDAPNPPAAPSGRPAALSSGSQPAVQPITPLVAQHLLATRPWVLFVSIFGFITCGLLLVGSLGLIAVSLARSPRFEFPVVSGGLLYVVPSVLYAVAAWLLYKYAAAIKRYRDSRSSRDMEATLGSQKSFWKFMGIVTIIVLGIQGLILGLIFLSAAVGGILIWLAGR